MENLSLNSALAVTLVSTAASLVLFLSVFSVKALAKVSGSSDLKDVDDTLGARR